MLESGCPGYRATALWILTEGGGVEASHWAGHEEVSDLSEGQQACWVVPLPLLLLDQTLQLLLEGLEEKRREEHWDNAMCPTLQTEMQNKNMPSRTLFQSVWTPQVLCSLNSKVNSFWSHLKSEVNEFFQEHRLSWTVMKFYKMKRRRDDRLEWRGEERELGL